MSIEDQNWVDRFEQSGPLARLGMLGGGAVRLAARAIDGALERAASIAADAEDAFRKELDPNVRDATILNEINDETSVGSRSEPKSQERGR